MTDRTDPWTRLATLWPLLAVTRFPGTPRPWRPAELTGAQRADRDARLRAERHLAEVFLEAVPAPLHLDVLDELDQLWHKLITAANGFGVTLSRTYGLTEDPRPLLDWCREQARTRPGGIVADDAAWAMLRDVERALGEIWAGQKLTAECPWCHGGLTIDRQTWHVRMLPAGVDPKTGDAKHMPAIVCESGVCEPPESDVGTWWRGMPAFPLWEWEWLAQRVEASDRKAG